jgi:phage recombination protein Bet
MFGMFVEDEMSKSLVKRENGQLQAPPQPPALTPEQLKMLQQTACAGHTLEQAQCFVEYCRTKGMDPFAREIYSIIRSGKGGPRQTFQIGIDALRKRAEETGAYEGQTPYLWCGPDGKWVDIWLAPQPPFAAKVGVWKHGFREPMWAIAKFSEYKPEDDWMWKKMPANQIAKCAEALALRRAFPSQLGGMYATEEMAQANNPPGIEQATQIKAATLAERLEAPTIVRTAKAESEAALAEAGAAKGRLDAQRGIPQVPSASINMDSEPDALTEYIADGAADPVALAEALATAAAEPGPDWTPPYAMLQQFRLAKRTISEAVYYRILGAHGVEKSNQFRTITEAMAALGDMREQAKVGLRAAQQKGKS